MIMLKNVVENKDTHQCVKCVIVNKWFYWYYEWKEKGWLFFKSQTACESTARNIITAATSLEEEEECSDTETRSLLKKMNTNEVKVFKNHVLYPISVCQSEGNCTSIDSAKIISLRIMSKLVKESYYFSEATKMEKNSKMLPDDPIFGEILE